MVDETTACAAIFELVSFFFPEDLGLASGQFWVGVHCCYQRLKPAACNLHIRVQQKVILGIYRFQGLVIAIGKTEVGAVLNDSDFGMMGTHPSNRIIRGGVIGHHKFGRRAEGRQKFRQKAF